MYYEDKTFIDILNAPSIVRRITFEHVDFSVNILKDLISEGLHGRNMLEKYKGIKDKIPHALNRLSEEAIRSEPMAAGEKLEDFLFKDD